MAAKRKLKRRLRRLEARVEALERAERWTPTDPPAPLSEPLDAQAMLRGVAEEYGRCYDMWGDDEWRAGVYI
jgi:hypothetical protein